MVLKIGENEFARIGPELLEEARKHHLQGDLQRAEELYRQILEHDPTNSNAYHRLGLIALQVGQVEQAEEFISAALELAGDSAILHKDLGLTYFAKDNLERAEKEFRTAISQDPELVDPYLYLGILLCNQERFDEAIWSLDYAVQLNPEDPKPFALLGRALVKVGQEEQAEEILLAAANLHPRDEQTMEALVDGLLDLNKPWQAIAWAEKLVEKQPDIGRYHLLLSSCLLGAGLLDQAIASARKAYFLMDNDPITYKGYALALSASAHWDEGLEIINKGLEKFPDHEALISQKASILERKGYYQEAYQLIRPLLSNTQSYHINTIHMLANISRHFDAQRETADFLEDILGKKGLNKATLQGIHFQLADLYDDLGEYDQAFSHLKTANDLKPRKYVPKSQEKIFAAIKNICTRDLLTEAPKANVPGKEMIFIVGMPRSGTSLTEQILASHPQVFGAGELDEIGAISHRLAKIMKTNLNYPKNLIGLDQKSINEAAQSYLERIEQMTPQDKTRVTDKMPQNFLHLGLIYLMFPQAKIIHCRRDPLDTCLSCYFQNFVAQGLAFAYDLQNLGHYYRLYQDLMNHWHQVLPYPIYDLQYEKLIKEPEREIRKLLEFCALDWHPGCLRFYETKRDIKTASYDQARKPIYKTSVGRWKNYAKYLEPLRQALDGKFIF